VRAACQRTGMRWLVGLAMVALWLLAMAAWPCGANAQAPEGEPAQEEILEAKVGHIAEEGQIEVMGREQLYQKLELIVTSGPKRGDVIVVENGTLPQVNVHRYRVV